MLAHVYTVSAGTDRPSIMVSFVAPKTTVMPAQPPNGPKQCPALQREKSRILRGEVNFNWHMRGKNHLPGGRRQNPAKGV